VAGYWVTRDGGAPATVTTTQFNDTGLTGGVSYLYTVQAFDANGNASGVATKSWTQPVPDTLAPSQVSLTGTKTKSRVNLSWTAATDNVGVVGYRVYRNGVLVATTTSRTWSDALRKGTMTYTVRAYDAAGNQGTPSNAYVTVK